MFESEASLIEKIRLGEDSRLELKSVRMRGARVEAPTRDDLADEIAAFANTADGVLVLGADDKTRKLEGVAIEHLDAVEALVREVCQDSIKPPPMVHIIRYAVPGSAGATHGFIRVDVPRSLFVHRSPGGYMQRVGSSKRELSPELLARLFQQRSQTRLIRFDEQAVPGTTPETLVRDLWKRFAGDVEEDPLVTLDKLKLIVRDDTGTWRATVGGVLLCTEHPERWLPNAQIEAVHYAGADRDANTQVDARTITGPLDRQIADALFFVERNMLVGAVKAPGRIDRPQYSVRAVFEAIVNAVAHRDYSIHGSRIRLFMFADRLELYSPGALANTLTVESMPLRQSTRNELIASLLAKCTIDSRSDLGRARIMDKRGEGVPIIVRETQALAGAAPRYSLLDGVELRLTVPAATAKPPAT